MLPLLAIIVRARLPFGAGNDITSHPRQRFGGVDTRAWLP